MIRVNVAAAIVRNDKILVIEYNDENGPHYNLPGGGVEDGESLVQALEREVREEAGVRVEVGALLMEWEYVPARYNNLYGAQQKVGLIYEAFTLEEPDLNHRYDDHQTGVRWLPLKDLLTAETVNFFGRDLLSALHTKNRLRGDIDLRRHSLFTPVDTPTERSRQYSFKIFCDNHLFVISQVHDNDADNEDEDFVEESFDAVQEYIDETREKALYYTEGYLIVGTERSTTAPVLIDILSQKPTPETLETLISTASQVGICGFEVTSSALMLHQMSPYDMEGIMEIEPGTYEVMIFYNDLDKHYRNETISDNWYHIIFYPGDISAAKLIKTYIPKPKKR